MMEPVIPRLMPLLPTNLLGFILPMLPPGLNSLGNGSLGPELMIDLGKGGCSAKIDISGSTRDMEMLLGRLRFGGGAFFMGDKDATLEILSVVLAGKLGISLLCLC